LGGEYQKLSSFFDHIGITHLVSCPHTHQQHGVAERKHCHIVEVGLALLANASMPLKFWDEAFQTADFLINRLPTLVLDHDSPIENLFATKPAYFFLTTFGCACCLTFVRILLTNFPLDPCNVWFLRYNTQHKGYKSLDVSTGHVYISHDVVFDEEVFSFSKLHANAGAWLRAKISLLPQALLESTSFGGSTTDDASVPKSTDRPLQCCASQEIATILGALNHLVLSPGDAYFLHQDDVQASLDSVAAEDPGVNFSSDSVVGGASESTLTAPP
jgi:hypothetical protein